MNTALTARQLERKRGAHIKRICHRVNRKIPSQKNLLWPPSNSKFHSTGFTDPQTPTAQMIPTMAAKQLSPLLLLNVPIHHQLSPPLNPTSTSVNQTSASDATQLVSEVTPLACCWLFAKSNPLNNLRPKGTGATSAGPGRPIADLLW
jgi:hypothetical protein